MNCTFINNEGYSGVMRVLNDGNIINNATRFIGNRGQYGGVIYMRDHVACINTDCTFLDNSASKSGGSIYGRNDVEVINSETRFISNRGQWGGVTYIRDHVSCINTDSTFQNNSASEQGGVIYGRNDVKIINTNSSFQNNSASDTGGAIRGYIDIEVINIATRFINNRAISGHGGAFSNTVRGKYINTGCIFTKNQAGQAGGVMGFWQGVNCTMIDSSFTENTGTFKIRQHKMFCHKLN